MVPNEVAMDSSLRLISPIPEYFPSYASARQAYQEAGLKDHEFSFLPAKEFFQYVKDDEVGKNLPAGYVPETRLWLVNDQEFLGEICLRHRLTDSLRRLGGHIGYGIRLGEWNKGYGTAMLRMALPYCHEVLHLDKVLITCADTNFASARVIESNGGVLEDKIPDVVAGKPRITRRYWITL
jgi:predicted acetyltransferase